MSTPPQGQVRSMDLRTETSDGPAVKVPRYDTAVPQGGSTYTTQDYNNDLDIMRYIYGMLKVLFMYSL